MRKTPKTQPEPSVFRDFVALTKPSITMMCVLMAAGGIGLAPGTISGWELISTLAGIALIVGSANALNMAWEHETDKLMQRTKKRPLPAGRMSVKAAWTFGAMIGMAGLWMLCVGANPQASLIGGLAIFAYVFVYTPMKRVSPLALLIGSFPGAAPPLIGWVAVTGTIDAAGLVLFGIVMLWQIPHFAAI
ncbi:protoheme IX farnesyltransferase, partial [bacterium]|nr:protoheme IX farnesyltransferase [bacterium]